MNLLQPTDFLLSEYVASDWNSIDKNSVDTISLLTRWRRNVAKGGVYVMCVSGDIDAVQVSLYSARIASGLLRRPVRSAAGPHVIYGRRAVMIGVRSV